MSFLAALPGAVLWSIGDAPQSARQKTFFTTARRPTAGASNGTCEIPAATAR